MSSGLSATCATAMGLAQEYEGRVHVVDNQRISVTQRQSVEDAIALREAGRSGAEIKKILEEEKFNSSIYITLETLKYLKKGGRITPAAAAIGTVLNLKPVLQLQGREARCFCQGKRQEAGQTYYAEGHEGRLRGTFCPVCPEWRMCLQAAYTPATRKRHRSGSRRCRRHSWEWRFTWIRCPLAWHVTLDMVPCNCMFKSDRVIYRQELQSQK